MPCEVSRKKDVCFVWTGNMQCEFDVIKQMIANSTGLSHFDTDKPVGIETVASLKGLVTVHMQVQDGKPVQVLSKPLMKAEANYSNKHLVRAFGSAVCL